MRARSPFSPITVLAMVLAGAGMLLAMLWMVGAGLTMGDTNDGGAHAGGKGLNGYAGLYRLLEKSGYDVSMQRDEHGANNPSLLILTPPAYVDTDELNRVVNRHRIYGPVLVILPKWDAFPAAQGQPGAKQGWVRLGDADVPAWKGFLDDLSASVDNTPLPAQDTHGHRPTLPDPHHVMVGKGEKLAPLVVLADNRILAARYDDSEDEDAPPTKLALIFEPDLVNNMGLAHQENAKLALALIHDLLPAGERRIAFDLTLNGFKRTPNLLTLAFTPPYLAATICLLLAALAAGWRAFRRFGLPQAEEREIALGKRALAENTAGLIRRARRYHLLPGPYGDAVRGRLIAALGLSPHADPATTDAAIDRALHARDAAHEPFTAARSRLAAARRPADILRAAQSLHAIERMLNR